MRRVPTGSRLHQEAKTLSAQVGSSPRINMLSRRVGRVPDRWLYNYAHAVVDGKEVQGPTASYLFASGFSVGYVGMVGFLLRCKNGIGWVSTSIREFYKSGLIDEDRFRCRIRPAMRRRLRLFCGWLIRRSLHANDCANDCILYPAVGDVFWDPESAGTFACDRPNFRRLSFFPKLHKAARGSGAPENTDENFEQMLGSPDVFFHANNFYCPQG